MPTSTQEKLVQLREQLHELGPVAVAFSGGLDSTLLVKLAGEVQQHGVVAIIASSAIRAETELQKAEEICRRFEVPLSVCKPEELADARFTENTPERCYYCKQMLFAAMQRVLDAQGLNARILDGTNATDGTDFRPGSRAAREAGVRSPLAEVGLTKVEIRTLAQQLDLPYAGQPSSSCLCSRVPYYTPLSARLLQQVEQAERIVRETAPEMQQLRLRHHGDIARIEVPAPQITLLTRRATRERLVRELRALGYTYVCIDLAGYHTGSMNQSLPHYA